MDFKHLIFDSGESFARKAGKIFAYQREQNPIYRRFCKALGVREVEDPGDIPLLPIEAFRETEILSRGENNLEGAGEMLTFRSSGTTGMNRSAHYVSDPSLYRESILRGIGKFYNLEDYVIRAYAPGYRENPESSLVWMLNTLIEQDESGQSGFIEAGEPLAQNELKNLENSGRKLMLFGAAFGLLDIIEKEPIRLPADSVILETGGVKTYRREMKRGELHQRISAGFGIPESRVHSEYGMTELLSQAYQQEDEWFRPVPWLKVSIRNPENPMEELKSGEEGLIGLMDLANVHSCSFILSGDKGLAGEDGAFRVLGRWNPQDLRGCNFLIDRD